MFDAAKTLRESRLAAGLTQAQLAARLGVSQPTVAGWERPGANPTVRTLDRALAATGRRLGAAAGEPPGVDVGLIREHLELTSRERLGVLESLRRQERMLSRARKVRRVP